MVRAMVIYLFANRIGGQGYRGVRRLNMECGSITFSCAARRFHEVEPAFDLLTMCGKRTSVGAG